MTLRLVALMSVVLLLSLAGFGLAMSRYQDQVMDEVAHTASVVGQAAIRTLERHHLEQLGAGRSPDGDTVMLWQSVCPSPGDGQGDTRSFSYEIRRTEAGATPPNADGQRLVEIRPDAPALHREVIRKDLHCEAAAEGQSGDVDCVTRLEGLLSGKDDAEGPQGPQGTDARLFISVDRVRAVADPADGLVLKIPTFVREGQATGVTNTFELDPSGGPVEAALDEINLRIPVEQDYDELFASIRGRSMALFFGVFVVGSVLSAGLASRFTRPIRRLDGGIRRLAAGDLDVEVEVHGKDEIARLGRAFNDMARRLRANRDRSRELVRKEKLSALGRLAAGVAHDVRNPLHSIGLTLDHLDETGRPGEEERAREFDRSLEVIRGEIRRLDRLVGNFLGFAGSERGARQEVDLAGLLHETVRLVGKEAERRGVALALEVDPDAGGVVADGEALRSSILNLVLNSFEAMPDGGRLTLELHPADGEVLLDVADTGLGIPEEDQDRIFDFAYTTREQGNGMGLAMVHHCIVEDHGGRVTLDSRPGEGTRVRLAIPTGSGPARDRC